MLLWLIFSLKILCVISIPLKDSTEHKIIVAVAQRKPFTIINENGSPSGLDVQIIDQFARKFNLEVDYVLINSPMSNYFADVEHAKTFQRFSVQANLSKSDVVIGALDESIETNEQFIASHPYHEDELTWCVQQKQPIANWRNVFHLYENPYISILVISTAIIWPSVCYFLQQFEHPNPKWSWPRILTTSIGISIGATTNFRPMSNSSRIFFAFSFSACLCFIVCFLAFFKDVLINPIFKHQIQSIQEIVDGSFELVGDKIAFEHIIRKNETYSPEVIKSFKISKNLDECLAQVNENPKLAVAISLAHVQSYRLMFPSQLYCFQGSEIIHKYALKFFIRNDFPYLKQLNEFIKMAHASGLIKHWYSNNLMKTTQTRERAERSYNQLELRHFYGIFFICVMVVMVLILLFIFEIIVYAKARARNATRFWETIEMLIDPERYFMLETKWT